MPHTWTVRAPRPPQSQKETTALMYRVIQTHQTNPGMEKIKGAHAMGIEARAAHNWCVTRGNHPDQHPYYCPLTQLRHSAAVAEYHQLLQPAPDNATDFYTRLADMAVVIPQQDAAFWYHLTAAVTTTWMPINANTDLEAARKAALAQIATRPTPRILGDHPATSPTTSLEAIQAELSDRWLVTRHGDNANTPGAWNRDIIGKNIDSLARAQHLYLTLAHEINATDDHLYPPEPTHNITFWHCLQITATTPWYPDHTHTSATTLINILYNTAQTP